MQKFFRHLFTGKDGRTYDIGRVLLFEIVQAFILLTIYAMYKGGTFDPLIFGGGLASIMGASMAGLAMKGNVEPEALSITTASGVKFSQSRGKTLPDDDGDTSDGDPSPSPAAN